MGVGVHCREPLFKADGTPHAARGAGLSDVEFTRVAP
jgi:hypothetical protein